MMNTFFVQLPFKHGLKCIVCGNEGADQQAVRNAISSHLSGFSECNDLLLYINGKELSAEQYVFPNETVLVSFKLPGGKGGFGSMLRAIGAQIEKTTNREACRDLSGRRLRDINEEQRLKKWIGKKAEREAEKIKRRKEKIERLKSRPKHNFMDFEYEKEISSLPERVDEALSAGLQKIKRPLEINEPSTSSAKKRHLWLDEEISESSDSDLERKLNDGDLERKSSDSDLGKKSGDSDLLRKSSDSDLGNKSSDLQCVESLCEDDHCSTLVSKTKNLASLTSDESSSSSIASSDYDESDSGSNCSEQIISSPKKSSESNSQLDSIHKSCESNQTVGETLPKKDPVRSRRKPERPSAFFLYLTEIGEKIKKDHPRFMITQVAKKACEMWKEVEDKSKWEEKAAALKKKYEKDMAKYEAYVKRKVKQQKTLSDKDKKSSVVQAPGSFETKEYISSSSDNNDYAELLLQEIIKSNAAAKNNDTKPDEDIPINLDEFSSAVELETLGLQRLKSALMERGLKCGGSIVDRAQRLWAVHGLRPAQYPKNLLAKSKK